MSRHRWTREELDQLGLTKPPPRSKRYSEIHDYDCPTHGPNQNARMYDPVDAPLPSFYCRRCERDRVSTRPRSSPRPSRRTVSQRLDEHDTELALLKRRIAALEAPRP